MNILAINSSFRGNHGLTGYLLGLIRKGCQIEGADFSVINLCEKEIQHCLGCNYCQNNDHLLKCVYDTKDDVQFIYQSISKADLIIYATPIYVFGLSSLLKTLLERLYATGNTFKLIATKSGLLFHEVNANICSKPFVSLICCDNIEFETTENARNYFKNFAKFLDAPHVGDLYRNGGQFLDFPMKNVPANNPKIQQIHDAFIQAGQELARNGKVSKKTERMSNQDVIPVPFFHLLKRIHSPALKQEFANRAQIMLNKRDN